MKSKRVRNKEYECWDWINEYGNLHREDGPARLYDTGSKFWYINGKLHRENGPAMEFNSGTITYYLDNIKYSHYDWLIIIRTKKLEELLNG